MKLHIASMILTQGMVNESTIGLDWREKGCNFYLAIQQECAEGVDHVGWKWWAKQEKDIEKAKMEVIDIMHFVLAASMVSGYQRNLLVNELADELLKERESRNLPFTMDAQQFHPRMMDSLGLFSLVSTMAGLRLNPFGTVCLLGESLGMQFDELFRLYSAKAVLNIFRQKNGYKVGQYKKLWVNNGHTVEDNEVLQKDILHTLDSSDPGFPHALYHALEERYALEVK